MKRQTTVAVALRVAMIFLVASLFPVQKAAAQVDYGWELYCGGNVKPLPKKLKLASSGEVTHVEDSIELCTKHVYSFTGKAGQQVDVRLTGSDGVSMFLMWKNQRSPEQPALFYMDRKWAGRLPTSGKYTLTVVTERKIAAYEVELKVD